MLKTAAIVGPTASGKSEVALIAAGICDGEIISCDSVQVYQGLDIGSGKLRKGEQRGIPHHLLDVASPLVEYTVAEYQRDARRCIEEISSRNRLPIFCGGTGLYLRGALDDYDFQPADDDGQIRAELLRLLDQKGSHSLHDELNQVDPVAATRIHPHDHVRIIRALEVFRQSGKPIGESHRARRESLYQVQFFGLDVDRSLLYQRIEARVDQMMEDGLMEETRRFLETGVSPEAKVMQTLGYRHMVQLLRGDITIERAVELMKRDTRHYAKRQLTWFRRDPRIQWLPADTNEQLCRAGSQVGNALRKFRKS